MRNYYRLKSNLSKESLEDRLKYNPHTIELYLYEEDLYEKKRISNTVRYLKDLGIEVMIHQPMDMRGNKIDINHENYDRDLYFLQLGIMSNLADELDAKVVVHGNYICDRFEIRRELSLETYRRIENVLGSISDNILWENAMWSSFSFTNSRLIEDIIKPLNLRLTFDISHAFIDFKGDY